MADEDRLIYRRFLGVEEWWCLPEYSVRCVLALHFPDVDLAVKRMEDGERIATDTAEYQLARPDGATILNRWGFEVSDV